MYEYYGKHVYKLGKTIEFKNRKCGYTTSYVKPLELIIISKKLRDNTLAEKILFYLLRNYRLVANREFFKCDISIIRTKITEVEEMFDKYTNEEIYKKFPEIFRNTEHKLNLKLDSDIDNIDDIDNTDDIYEEIIKNNDNVNEMYPERAHIIDKIKKRIDILDCKDKNIILNDDNFEKELCVRLLKMNKNTYEKKKVQMNKYSYLFITKLLKKIDTLHEIEKILKIKRYAVNDINEKNMHNYIRKLLNINHKLYVFGIESHSVQKNINVIKKRIEKIERIDQLQKVISDFYNSFDKIINYDHIKKQNVWKYINFTITALL
jgi:hypothetical protein